MNKKIILNFEEDEISALEKLAKMEFRDIEGQVAHLIRNELERRGLLEVKIVTEGKTEKKFIRLDE